MLFRYCIATKKDQINRFFNAKPVFDYHEHYNAAIDMFLPVIVGPKTNEIVELKWQFPWLGLSKHPLSHFIPTDNIITHWKQTSAIRSTLLTTIRNKRCAILANCFVVWKQQQPFCVYVQDQRLFAFGGIWNETSSHTGFALLMQHSNELLVRLGQPLMPLILQEWQVHYWLNIGSSYAKITGIMKNAYPSHKMNAYPISPEIANPALDHPGIFMATGEKMNPEIDYGVKERLVRQGWGRNKISS